ncbi:MAG: 23S rRNA (uracil(1939)-C(5))-methyltransferase RlmD [Lachnospiraceae bacterium]|nr:23S rRNA (uracil(1939)-C(5))-methyltransferase RlmD [Lachnospiraceae bacterium]
MEIKKNDQFDIFIEDMTEEGEGVGKVDGFTLFVKGAVIGDQARVKVMKTKKTYGYARLMEVLVPSPDRVEPVCPVAGPCGGCQLQALSYERQLAFKEEKVRNQLKRIGGFENPPVLPAIGMEHPFGYRNKAQFPMGRNKEGRIITGFYAGRTHSIIETPRCYLGSPVNEEILDIIIRWMEEFRVQPYDEEGHRGLVRHVLIRTGEKIAADEMPSQIADVRQLMVCLIINGKKLPHSEELVKRLQAVPGMTSISYNINTERTNVILGKEVRHLFGNGYITDTIGDIRYRISPQSFYQVNPEQTAKLYGTALEYAGLTGDEIVWDLYCGTGTITLFLAQQAKEVRGVEIVPAAIEDANANAAANGITNAQFYVGKAEEILPQVYEKERVRADVVVVDPPRKGCDQTLLDTILEMEPDRVVYVSCGPATLARDLKILCEEKYDLVKVQPVDMFAQTVGIENVALLTKRV